MTQALSLDSFKTGNYVIDDVQYKNHEAVTKDGRFWIIGGNATAIKAQAPAVKLIKELSEKLEAAAKNSAPVVNTPAPAAKNPAPVANTPAPVANASAPVDPSAPVAPAADAPAPAVEAKEGSNWIWTILTPATALWSLVRKVASLVADFLNMIFCGCLFKTEEKKETPQPTANGDQQPVAEKPVAEKPAVPVAVNQ